MRSKTDLFTVNGQPMLAPDGSVAVSYSDIDGADAGRDQNGVLHRSVVRYKVAAWEFTYTNLTQEEKDYLESLFPDAPTFLFGHPHRTQPGVQETTVCYRSQYGIHWRSAVTGLWSELRFSVIEV
jgi:hypothetical protein